MEWVINLRAILWFTHMAIIAPFDFIRILWYNDHGIYIILTQFTYVYETPSQTYVLELWQLLFYSLFLYGSTGIFIYKNLGKSEKSILDENQ